MTMTLGGLEGGTHGSWRVNANRCPRIPSALFQVIATGRSRRSPRAGGSVSQAYNQYCIGCGRSKISACHRNTA